MKNARQWVKLLRSGSNSQPHLLKEPGAFVFVKPNGHTSKGAKRRGSRWSLPTTTGDATLNGNLQLASPTRPPWDRSPCRGMQPFPPSRLTSNQVLK